MQLATIETTSPKAVRAIVVNWINEATVLAKARENGWDGERDLLDYVNDPNDYDETKVFPSLTKAKAWARRNKALDLWKDPHIRVYEWPSARKRDYERECVLILRYIGEDGKGWQESDE